MSNIEKLKKVWFHLDATYSASGMESKRDFLMKFLGYREGSSGLPKLLGMLQMSCEFNADHEPLPEYKEDYDALQRVLNNADKLVQMGIDIEELNLDDIGELEIEEQGQEDIVVPSFEKVVNSVDVVSAMLTRFAGNYYDAETGKHMILAKMNEHAILLQNKDDYNCALTYLTTKIVAQQATTFDQLVFRWIVTSCKAGKRPSNVIFLSEAVYDLQGDDMYLTADGSKLNDGKMSISKKTAGKLAYQGIPLESLDYTIYKMRNKSIFGKMYTIYGFKANE